MIGYKVVLYYANLRRIVKLDELGRQAWLELPFNDQVLIPDHCYDKVAEIVVVKPIDQVLDYIFALYNGVYNEYNESSECIEEYNTGDYEDQFRQRIRECQTHASISIGDIIELNGKKFRVASEGFIELKK